MLARSPLNIITLYHGTVGALVNACQSVAISGQCGLVRRIHHIVPSADGGEDTIADVVSVFAKRITERCVLALGPQKIKLQLKELRS